MTFKRCTVTASAMALSMCLGQAAFGQGSTGQTSVLRVEVPPVVGRSTLLGHANPNQVVHLSVSLPYADPAGVQAFVDSVSDPKSKNYRHFITPEQVGETFGLSTKTVQSVADYLSGSGFKIGLIGKNRLSILADGTVAAAEAAFHTVINNYKANNAAEVGNPSYFSFSRPLQMPTAIAPFVIDVEGLESFTKPHPLALNPTQTRTLYDTAPMFNTGLQGQGRNLAISNFDGYRLSNVPLYYSQFGLPAPSGGVGSNITVVTVSGGAGSGTPGAEGDLDIQMVLGMAPLCNFIIYDTGASDLIGCLTREANDNSADCISESYGWSLPASTATSAHNLHLSMSAQGITYMAASGDSGTSLEPYSYPDYDPEVLMVGGSTATVDSNGNRTSEVGWSGSGGGWSTNTATFNTLPSWQVGTGVPTTINHRLVPDVALHASSSTGAYYFYLNGSLTNGYIGTSFASPTFCGSLGVTEQYIINQGGLPPNSAGKRRFGRIQNLFYSQNGRSDVWFDITSGSNGTLPNGSTSSAGAGWDFVTGFGAINFYAFANTQVSTSPPPAPTNLVATAGNAQVGLTWSASTGASSYNVLRGTTTGGPYSNVGSTTTTSFTDTGLTNGTTYFYVVTASNSAGTSGNSNEASATPNISIPPVPTNLKATAGNVQVALTWNASSGATSYNVKRSTTTGGPYTTIASPTTTSYTDTGLTNGTTYFYVVSAVNTAGESANSSQVSATPNNNPPQQLLLNPGFESGAANWTATPAVINDFATQGGEPPHSGNWDAWLDGYNGPHTDSLYQQVAIPSTITTATLSFWLHVDTAQTTTTTQYDTLKVQIRNSTGAVLTTLATYSNLNHNTGYAQVSFNVAAYKGQTIQVYLVGVQTTRRQTSFVVDDFSLIVQ